MNYLPDEKVLLESDNKTLVLTTHRIRYDALGAGSRLSARSEFISIMLEELASCAITHVRYPLLLLFALFGIALVFLGNQMIIVGLALAIICGGGFLLSQRQVLLLSSAGSNIQVNTAGMSLQSLREFVDQAEDAKNQRYRGSLQST